MRKRSSISALVFLASGLCLLGALLMAGSVANANGKDEDQDMVLEGIDGDVTTNEYKAFIHKLGFLPPPPTNDIGNLMVDERDGARLHGMQTFYEFTHDRRDLDMAIVWSDAFLHARNDPTNGRIIWTGKRDLCWPNKAPDDGAWALHAGAENGDVIEHIVNTARLILENPAVWNLKAPRDRFSFGATYLERAKTYVRECQRSAETTIVPWFVRSTRDGYRLYYPDSAAYFKSADGNEKGPIPWNQQQAIVGGLLRLAQCHRLLDDGNTNIAYYEQITADAARWFIANAMPVSAHNRVCYNWAYVITSDPVTEPESTIESDYDMFIFRAYQANLGPTRQQMQRLINTGRFVMYLGTNRIAGHVNGTSDRWRGDMTYLDFNWIEMSVLDQDFYRLVASTVLTSHEYWNNLPVEAAVLSAKHYWATTTNPPAEIIEDASHVPPMAIYSPKILPAPAIIGGTILLSLIGMGRITRSWPSVTTTPGHLRLLKLFGWIDFVAIGLGFAAACRLHLFFGVLHPKLVIEFSYGALALGLALHWFSALYLKRYSVLFYIGSLLITLALAASFWNWESFLIILVPTWMVIFARAALRFRAMKSNERGERAHAEHPLVR